jgi:anti-anti-sigma factor
MFTVTRQGAVQVVAGKETLAEQNLDELNRLLEGCLSEPTPRVVLNLTDVPLFDSLGLEWLLDAVERCAERGGQLQISSANPLCRDILSATGVGDRFEQFEDVRAAIRSFTR